MKLMGGSPRLYRDKCSSGWEYWYRAPQRPVWDTGGQGRGNKTWVARGWCELQCQVTRAHDEHMQRMPGRAAARGQVEAWGRRVVWKSGCKTARSHEEASKGAVERGPGRRLASRGQRRKRACGRWGDGGVCARGEVKGRLYVGERAGTGVTGQQE